MQIDTSKPVMVTGATGYVAGWVIKRLLEEGLTVHAAVRNPDNTEKRAHLDKIASETSGVIRYFKADLLDDGSYRDAMAGCGTVFHTASPFIVTVDDPQRDLVDPALNGTRNVLQSVNATETVTRVVLTSSCAAIYGDAADLLDLPDQTMTEEIWNTSSRIDMRPYSYSKTVAEQAAWDIAKAQERWRLVVVNPSFVMGPSLNKSPTSESFSVMRQIGDGTMKMGAPDLHFALVDVRDLAEAHLRAAFKPDAEGRHIISGHNTGVWEWTQLLRPEFGAKYPLPKKLLPKWLVWLIGPILSRDITRDFISRNFGIPLKADNSKSREKLGMTYRPLEKTVTEMFQQLVDTNQI